MTAQKPAPPLLSTAEAAKILGVDKRTLERLRGAGRGPQHTYVGRFVRYSYASLNAYLAARARNTRA